MEESRFLERQNNLLDHCEEGVFLIGAASLVTKSHDTEFPFRQNSDFKYLLGFNEPDSLLVLKKNSEGAVSRHLFLREKDPMMEMWVGKRLGTEKAPAMLSVDEAYDIDKAADILPTLLGGHQNLYFDLFDEKLDSLVKKAMSTLMRQRKKKSFKPLTWNHIAPLLGKLRLKKDQNEIQFMRKALRLTNRAHQAAMALSAPGRTEKEIATLMEYIFSQEDGQGQAYDSIVASGENALILHYIENNQTLKKDDLLLIDAGSQVNLYASDITRTFPVSGTFNQAQKDLYTIVLEAQKAAMAHARPGATLASIHKETCRSLAQALLEHKILEGSLDQVMEENSYRTYYPHGTGHWLGLDVHDQCPYLDDNLEDVALEEGMTFTIEPGLYFPANDPKVPAAWRGLGIRIEDDILVTDNGIENMSRAIPKEIKEVEEACSKSVKDIVKDLDVFPFS